MESHHQHCNGDLPAQSESFALAGFHVHGFGVLVTRLFGWVDYTVPRCKLVFFIEARSVSEGPFALFSLAYASGFYVEFE